MDLDAALAYVGGYRRWQIGAFLVLSGSLSCQLCWQSLAIVFIGWIPDHHCKVSSQYGNSTASNSTSTLAIDLTSSKCQERVPPSIHNGAENSSFQSNSAFNSSSRAACTDGWSYDSHGYYTITEQWDLVCQKDYMVDLSQMLFQSGSLLGDLVLSPFVDILGRKKPHIISHVVCCVFGISVAFSNSYIMFIITRTIVSVFATLSITSGSTAVMELFSSRHRTNPGIGQQFMWTFHTLLLGLLAYFVCNWRHLQIIISSASAIWIALSWCYPESVVWLASRGRWKEAEKVLRHMAKKNNVKIPEDFQLACNRPLDFLTVEGDKQEEIAVVNGAAENLSQNVKSAKTEKKSSGSQISKLMLLKDSTLLKFLTISSLLWFTCLQVFIGLMLSTPILVGNRFINFTCMALVDFPATALAIYSANRFGRRKTICTSNFLSGISLVATVLTPSDINGLDVSFLSTVAAVFGKGAITTSGAVARLYCKELFPTSLRGTSTGISQMWGKIGALTATAGVYVMRTSIFWLPFSSFAVVVVTVGFLVLLLPETKGKKLPETLQDCKDLYLDLSGTK